MWRGECGAVIVMELVQILLAALIFVCRAGKGQVSFDSDGPLFIPISTQRTITCSSTEDPINSWSVILRHSTVLGATASQGIVERFGITGMFMPPMLLQLIVNTSYTSIIGLRCVSAVLDSMGFAIRGNQSEANINLTIYGVPDPPAVTSLSLEGDSLRSSWDYVRIPTVKVTLYWSLSFFRPSQLSNITTTLINTSTYNYTLQGVRSCDPFSVCVRAENVVGNSSLFCINNTLPYLPLREDIDYSLVQVNDTFSLNVIVMIPEECQSAMNSYCLTVTNADGNEVTASPSVGSDNEFVIENLNMSSFYHFTIISNNSIGKQSTKVAPFCTNDIRGITVCPSALNENTYTIRCDYVSGCNLSGCSYNLTSMTDIPISGNIEGRSFNMIESNKVSQKKFKLTVRDLNGVTVLSENITFNDDICRTTTAATTITSEGPSESGGLSLSGGAIAAIIVVVLAAIVLMVAIIITICLIKLGYCHCCGTISEKKQQKNHESKVKFKKNGEGLPDVAIGSGNQRENVPDVAMNVDQQDGVTSQEPFYSSLNTTKPAVKVAAPVTTAGGDYAKINQEPVYFVLENEAPPKEVIPADEDAPPVPAYKPVDDVPVGGDITTSSAQPEAVYAEINTRSDAKL